jgi:hypothetical protein
MSLSLSTQLVVGKICAFELWLLSGLYTAHPWPRKGQEHTIALPRKEQEHTGESHFLVRVIALPRKEQEHTGESHFLVRVIALPRKEQEHTGESHFLVRVIALPRKEQEHTGESHFLVRVIALPRKEQEHTGESHFLVRVIALLRKGQGPRTEPLLVAEKRTRGPRREPAETMNALPKKNTCFLTQRFMAFVQACPSVTTISPTQNFSLSRRVIRLKCGTRQHVLLNPAGRRENLYF